MNLSGLLESLDIRVLRFLCGICYKNPSSFLDLFRADGTASIRLLSVQRILKELTNKLWSFERISSPLKILIPQKVQLCWSFPWWFSLISDFGQLTLLNLTWHWDYELGFSAFPVFSFWRHKVCSATIMNLYISGWDYSFI